MTTPPYDPNQQYPQYGNDPYGTPASPGPYNAANPYATPGYQATGYQAPGYPPPGYQQPYPQGYAYPMVAPVAPTNTMAILALVFAFIFAPLAIVFGHMARKQIRERGEQGSGLATAGLILGYVFTGLIVLLCTLEIVVFGVLVHSADTISNVDNP